MGCKQTLSPAVLLYKAASKENGLWETAEEASKDVGSTLSNNLQVVINILAVLATKHVTL